MSPPLADVSNFPWTLNSLPYHLNCEDSLTLFSYLRDVSNESQFAMSVLQIPIEERRSAHRTRWNTQRCAKSFEIGDVVKTHVQVQSHAATGTVKNILPGQRAFSYY